MRYADEQHRDYRPDPRNISRDPPAPAIQPHERAKAALYASMLASA